MVKVRNRSQKQYLEFDAQKYQQGGRTAYSLVMALGTLDSNVPNFVNTERIDKANRRFHPAHSKRIAEYMYDIEDWVLGSILLGIDPDAIEFIAYEEDDGQSSATLGFVRISLDGGTSSIMILDGQHRRMAVQAVRDRLRQEIQSAKDLSPSNGRSLVNLHQKLSRLDNMSIPVVLYEEANTKSLRRMFSDLAQTRNIDAVTKTRFDDRDPFNRAAVELVELGRSELLADRVEMERTTPGRNSNCLLSINQLARCLKVLNFGYGGRASRARILEAEHKYEDLIDLGILFADEFLPRARKEYAELCSIELEEDFVAKNRPHYFAYSVTAIQLLAGCYYRWDELGRTSDELANWFQDADFDVESEDCLFRKAGMLTVGKNTLVSQSQTVRAAVEYIVARALRSGT
ncbi:MAG: DGQHR domain-containing protein [Chloroflexota bacterium]|nr:DGQHR domain-containing protein [Chloroflexota bacterium]MDE2909649.1 DGQHR domain-containing protein [Chloroflexota bacterium]